MHSRPCLVPRDQHSGAMGAEHAVRGILRVRIAVVADLRDHFLRIVAGAVSSGNALSPGVAVHFALVSAKLRNRGASGEFRFAVRGVRRL